MATPFYVLDLNNPATPEKRLELAERCFFDANPDEIITDPHDIPRTGTLILYILGHAIPDALVVPALAQFLETRRAAVPKGTSFLAENAFAQFLVEQRGDNKTLLIWDLCFARSFEQIAGPGWSGKPYVHIFSSESYEQAWHTGDSAGTSPRRQTLFSRALKQATMQGGGFERWEELERRLRGLLEPVQHPSIVAQPLPADFEIPIPPTMVAGEEKTGWNGTPERGEESSFLSAALDVIVGFVRSISKAFSS